VLQGGALSRGFRLLPRALHYLRPYRKQAFGSIALTALLAAVALAEPWPLAFVVDSVVGDKPPPGWLTEIVGESTATLIIVAVVGSLLITLLAGGLTVVNEYLTTSVDQKMVLDFRSDLFQHAQRLPLSFHDDARTGMLMYRINNQAGSVGAIVVALPVVAQSVLTILGMAWIAWRIDAVLAGLALAVAPFVYYSTTYYADRIEPQLLRVRGMEGMNLTIVHEAMAMLRVILAFGRERHEFDRFRSQGEATVEARIKLTVRQTLFKLGVSFITAAGTAAVLGVGAYRVINGHISVGELLVIMAYIAAVYAPLEALTNTITGFQQQFIALDHALGILDTPLEVTEREGAISMDRGVGALAFEHVNFGYQTRPDTLRDISFDVKPGSALAVVGPTGAGKSTLVSLIPRFYDPDDGRVTIDGVDLRDLTLDSLRAQFSIVLQEPLLFSGSIFDNIRYGRTDATPDEVRDAARAANAHDFIMRLPDGYDTMLGERGTKVSGGERQRIAVARAFLRDAPILILDEPTSSIDSRTEGVILDALERLMEGRTTIMIAHRLSTVRRADHIVVLHEGQLVEQGSHDELMDRDGLYRQLWEAQMKERRDGEGGSVVPPALPRAVGPRPIDHSGHAPRPRPAEPEPATDEVPTPAPVDALGPAPSTRRQQAAVRPLWLSGGAARLGRRLLSRPRHDATARPKVVLLGMLSKIPVGGVAWLVGQYAVGFRRLGFDVYYVEAHGRTPTMFTNSRDGKGTVAAARYVNTVMKSFGMHDRWSYQALHDRARSFGMSASEVQRLYAEAELIVNLHGSTVPTDEQAAKGRLVYLGTDPVDLELELARGERRAIEFLEPHAAFFTWGLNHGNPDCRLPWSEQFPMVPSPPPVLLDQWSDRWHLPDAPFTTIGNWRQDYREIEYEGETYHWSKHHEFLKVIDLPSKVETPLELALSSYREPDRVLLEQHGWRVTSGLEVSSDLASYRDYVVRSSGEFSVAKDQNVRFRTGWFSERSATYLAAGRPVVLQDTGFGAALPTGCGLFGFVGADDAAAAIDAIRADPDRHRRVASEIARDYLSHDVVLPDMLDHMGVALPTRRTSRRIGQVELPASLSLEPISRRPLQLPDEVNAFLTDRPIPLQALPAVDEPEATIIIVAIDNPAITRAAIESVMANTGDDVSYELVLVDNGSGEQTRRYLSVLAARNPGVRLIRNESNLGFARANNQALEVARGDVIVLLNNDAVVTPGWLKGLARHLDDPEIGLVGPVTNRCGNEAEVSSPYDTYGGLLALAKERQEAFAEQHFDIPVAVMFCAALRRDTFLDIGPLDERYELGLFEDDDYARRVREAGRRVVCAEDVFVHHFGEASLGWLAAAGRYGELFETNKARYEEKWGVRWTPHARRAGPDYLALQQRLRHVVAECLPPGSTTLVISKGDDVLLELPGVEAWHFPRDPDGRYAGNYPADDTDAIAQLEWLRGLGARFLVVPSPSRWWLDHYRGFSAHLRANFRELVDDAETGTIFELVDYRHVRSSAESLTGEVAS
jgi:ATP-binding cassette, subfamily B, bacterial